jgi:hypothetical protein
MPASAAANVAAQEFYERSIAAWKAVPDGASDPDFESPAFNLGSSRDRGDLAGAEAVFLAFLARHGQTRRACG